MAGLLLILNIVVTRQGQDTFTSTVQAFNLNDVQPVGQGAGGVALSMGSTGVGESSQYTESGTASANATTSPASGSITLSGSSPFAASTKSPQDFFNEKFRRTLLWVTAIGIVSSLILGVLLANWLVGKPALRLRGAIQQLKNRNFKISVSPTGLSEFDHVVKDFNELTEELDRAEKLRQNLVSDTSHELNTPLTALHIQLEGMRDGLIEAGPKQLEGLLKQVHRLTDITERLQEYTRLRNQAARLNKTKIDVKKFFQDIVAENALLLKEAGIKTLITTPRGMTLVADKKLLDQVFINLITNTIRYSEATEVRITCTKNTIEFSDNGKGVPSEDLTNIFERFFRVEKSRNRKQGGLGLGLAIVAEIIDSHGWRIRAKNASPGLCISIDL
jgi:signal transduction histidine kinase